VTAGISFVDIDNDGYSDYGYVADLGGTLYRLSFLDNPTNRAPLESGNWSIKKIAYTSGARKFMFSPAVTFAGNTTVYVAMGSGDRERPLLEDYPYAMNVRNYVYAYRDTLDAYDAAVTPCNLDGAPGDTGPCVLDYTTAPADCSSPGILPSESHKAWRVGFVYQGEQAVTQPIILGGMIAVNTSRPVPAGVCSAALGEGGGYFLNLLNGAGAIGVSGTCGGVLRGAFLGVGLPTDPVVVNLPGQDPICIGCVSKTNTNPSLPSKLFQPTPVPPPISKIKSRKYRYKAFD
jgi:Tfp pilus tip-associated adhesin PilY1